MQEPGGSGGGISFFQAILKSRKQGTSVKMSKLYSPRQTLLDPT